jgi:hypothetical protein
MLIAKRHFSLAGWLAQVELLPMPFAFRPFSSLIVTTFSLCVYVSLFFFASRLDKKIVFARFFL